MSSLEALRAKMLAQRTGTVVAVNETKTITISPAPRIDTNLGSNSELDLVLQRISRLQEHMENSIPGFESILSTVHKELSRDATLTHLLKDEDIGVLVSAMAKRKNVVISIETAKKLGKKALSKTTVDDLI